MRCKTCRYNLAHLPECRCPECGREFDPNDSDSFASAVSRRQVLSAAVFLLFACIYLAALFAYLFDPAIIDLKWPRSAWIGFAAVFALSPTAVIVVLHIFTH